MKKIVNLMALFTVLFVLFSTTLLAASLDTIKVTTSKQTVHPGETVKLNVDFGKQLGAYTVDIAYDHNLLEFVSGEGGTGENDNGTRVRVTFYDQTGGSAARQNMSVTFKAKEGLTTSNPTDLSVTAEGLANADASVTYDDITTPIVKNIIVEPKYEDYNIRLNYTGNVIVNEEKDMKLIISSSMGKNYEHTRIIAQATTPTGKTAKLLATDSQGLEHDIIQSGWGDASGEALGGKDVSKELAIKGLFDGVGDYSITIKIIDRDNSDAVIASKTFNIAVTDKNTQTPSTGNTNNNQNTTNNNTTKPNKLPKTGNTVYLSALCLITILASAYIYTKKED